MEDQLSRAPVTIMAGDVEELRFPPGLLWGAATSAHQVEGGNRHSDWWAYEQAGKLPFRSGDACRHFELYAEDFDLARSLEHNCHRFSIEWSRIEPAQRRWDDAALAHYERVLEALEARNLEPVVTLHHFTSPAWFTDGGGWVRDDSPAVFARFVARLVEHIGPRVRYWLTINEPTVYVLQGYVNGEWPPLEQLAWRKAYKALRNLARAHVAAHDVIKSRCADARVSFAHHALAMQACDPARRPDRAAARRRDWVYNRLFFQLIAAARRAPAERTLDFLGLNYYTRCNVRAVGWGIKRWFGEACKLDHHADGGRRSLTDWEVYPRGLGEVLRRFATLGLPLFITENGLATDDDRERLAFLHDHLREMADAMATGVGVLGYLHWSLIDNYEWALGTRPRFGLAAVDYATQERTPRASARHFAAVCRDNRLRVCFPEGR